MVGLPSMVSMSTPSVVGVSAGSAVPLLFCHCHIAPLLPPTPGRGYPVLGDLKQVANTRLKYHYNE
jgi:hypothetical protein